MSSPLNWIPKLPRIAWAAFTVVLLAAAPVRAAGELLLSAADGDAQPQVSGTLTDIPVQAALASLAGQGGFEVHVSPRLGEHKVDITLDSAPLPQAIATLLAGIDYIVRYDDAGSVGSVYVFAPGEESPQQSQHNGIPVQTGPIPSEVVGQLPENALTPEIRAALIASATPPSAQQMEDIRRRRQEILAAFQARFGPKGAAAGSAANTGNTTQGEAQ